METLCKYLKLHFVGTSLEFLADLTDGRPYAAVLHLSSVCLSSVTYVLWLNGASHRKTLKK